MEDLLNKLIKMGWKPFNVDCAWTNVEVINRLRDNQYLPEHTKIIFKTENHWHVFDCNIRDLVSKSSGLWQFCCVNKLCKYNCNGARIYKANISTEFIEDYDYRYRLIESALCDEDKLEQFILDNIQLGK